MRKGLVLVPEGRLVFAQMTIEENLLMGAYKEPRRERIAALLESAYTMFPRLRERRRLQAGSLSGGEQQMLAIARALAGNPRIVVLDEPTEGLAPLMVELVRQTLEQLRGAGYALLLVEQNFRLAGPLADEIHVLNAGRVVERCGPLGGAALAALAERHLGIAH